MVENRVSDWPSLKENHWFSISLSLVLIGLAFLIFFASWVFIAPNLSIAKNRIDVVTPFATVYLALVTFSTVAWRGLVGARQADQQKAQNDANEDANYAKLLQEGAKLLGDAEKHQDQIAGLATLEVVIQEPKRRFSEQALNVVANFYAFLHRDISKEAVFGYNTNSTASLAHAVITKAVENGVRSTIRARFTAQTPDMRWPGICGYLHQTYSGGSLTQKALDIIGSDKFLVRKAVVHKGEFPPKLGEFDACTFRRATVTRVSDMDAHFDNHRFESCNFSGCYFYDDPVGLDELFNLRKHQNWYDIDDPPKYERPVEWELILIAKRKTEDGRFVNVKPEVMDF